MIRLYSNIGFLVAASLGLTALGCNPGGVGDPCIPEDEYKTDFAGYSFEEVNIESRSFQCETRVCLVNHFQGRVSCPYGQSKAEADESQTQRNWGTRCAIPGTKGDDRRDRIWRPVSPQKAERRTSEAVYCSCRCMNAQGKTDDGARYCKCPNGFKCRHLIDDIGLGRSQMAGGYCVKTGTEYNEAAAKGSPTCTIVAGAKANTKAQEKAGNIAFCGPPKPY